MKVLLVHPEPSQRDAIAQALSDQEFDVVAVGDTEDGMREFRRQNPGIVVVALEPAVDECERFCVRLRSRSDAPIIVIGKDRREGTLFQILRSGADIYLRCPTARELVARVRSLLRRTKPKGDKPEGNAESRSAGVRAGLSCLARGDCRVFFRLKEKPGLSTAGVHNLFSRRNEDSCVCTAAS